MFNYLTCVITGTIVNGYYPLSRGAVHEKWFIWACIMGTIFIVLFNLIAITAQKIGVAVASVANKLSLVVPFILSIYLYNEVSTVIKITGVITALVAVVLTCYPPRRKAGESVSGVRPVIIILPLLLFIGSGLLDSMIKYVEQTFLNGTNNNDYLVMAFSAAALIGTTILIIRLATGVQRFEPRAVLAGMLIGVPNYFSIWCLVTVLKMYPGMSSSIIPVNNMGIVLFSAVVAMLLFKERLSLVNWAGILLSLTAITMIAFG